ncbi:DUF7059 domain-containing protein [Brachybacterium sp. J153]|uniref:DUF7059 domain-containing protein n=1 Tax=Brachybacterium sp. J153 TaxID=3116488 RepID=UPI002E77ABCD|nr:methyltransferase [Brachybacterium sp. J153]MEE1618006.1 methyltransferase [Brachybacterium sp. J153]
MPTDVPQVQPALISALRADLRAADYTVARTEELLGEVAVAALRRENPLPARRALAGSSDPAALLFSLLTLGSTATRAEVDAALPSLGASGAEELGILGIADLDPGGPGSAPPPLRALIDLAPYAAQDDLGEISWWIASDPSELATGRPLGPEHVLGVGGASLTLARITPRERVSRVLDLGCGGGIQALHASRHAEHVVATDLSDRALAMAAFNAALNQIELDLRHGSLLEPVAGERFDLIVSNPPFVITPRQEPVPENRTAGSTGGWTYRDGGRAGDTLLAELLAALPAHLSPGGRAVLLGNWEIPADADWDTHPCSWLEPARTDGVDAWVIQREQEDPAQYAETWARDGGITDRDPAWTALVGDWLEDFASRDTAAIGFGYLLLRRPGDPGTAAGIGSAPAAGPTSDEPRRPGVLRTEHQVGSGSGTLGEHLAAGLRMLSELEDLDDDALLASRPVRAADVVERRHLTPGAWDPLLIELVQGAGLGRVVPADQILAGTVGALDGTLTLGQVLGAVCALTDSDADAERSRILPLVRDLLISRMVTL